MSSVSVQIVTYNSKRYIEACLQAVFAQTYPIAEVIVVDNHSQDGTLDALRPFAERIRLFENRENRGFAGGHNQALRDSKSEYVLVLNPDVTLHPEYVQRIVAHLEQHPQTGSATGLLLFAAQPDRVDSAGLVMKKARRAFDRGASEPASAWQEPGEVFGVSGAAAMYRRAMVDDVSLEGEFFDESFFAYKEDVDVAWRARLLGWAAAYVPAAVAYHERGWKQGKRTSQPLFIRKHSYINRYRMILKNESLGHGLLHLPFWLCYECAALAYSLLREPQLLTAWGQFLRDLPRMRRQRIEISKRRKASPFEVYRFFE